ncbi:MAG: glycosyltransferase family 4 protein [Treponema sp.]|nr:glycosyltransferase family 4 protein [Treponema sp.]
MRVLFVTSEHPGYLFGGLGTFTREYVRELRKYCDVKCVYFHLSDGRIPLPDETVDYVFAPEQIFDAFTPEARILESAASLRKQLEPLMQSFKPDVIHCNDRQTYMPFRFEKNVFYSSHLIFTDLIASSYLDDLYFQEVKVERCAIENSAVVASYSEFSAKCVEKHAGNLKSAVVLPLGLRTEKFHRNFRKDGKIRVCYFGRFENVQKGVNDFIYAVNQLGPQFKRRNSVEYCLYGRGQIDVGMDLSLFNKPEFLEGDELFEAYANADIVVMPSHYEPFGLTGLEAMASGALLLVTTGLGMDEYAEPGRNCIGLSGNAYEMVSALRNAILDLPKLNLLRENAVRTAKNWTWKRCVKSHLYFYRFIAQGRIPFVNIAYEKNQRKIISAYKKSNDVEKIYAAEEERVAFTCIYDSLSDFARQRKTLVLTGNFVPDEDFFPDNFKFVPVLEESEDGVVVRPECLPFADNDFDSVIVCGAWESVLNPCSFLMELERVANESVQILYKTGKPREWQTFQMESEDDWTKINQSGWICRTNSGSGVERLKQTVSFDSVVYRNHSDSKEVLNEIIA